MQAQEFPIFTDEADINTDDQVSIVKFQSI